MTHHVYTIPLWGKYRKSSSKCPCCDFITANINRRPLWEIGESKDRRFESGACRFEIWLSQTNDVKTDTSSLPSLVFGTIRSGQGLVGSVSG